MQLGWDTTQLELWETQRPVPQLALSALVERSRSSSWILSSKWSGGGRMRLSAARRTVLLLFLVVLIGVWVGHSRLLGQQLDGQDHPRSAEMRSDVERRMLLPDR